MGIGGGEGKCVGGVGGCWLLVNGRWRGFEISIMLVDLRLGCIECDESFPRLRSLGRLKCRLSIGRMVGLFMIVGVVFGFWVFRFELVCGDIDR